MKRYSTVINDFISAIGSKFVVTGKWQKQPFVNGWRYGNGDAVAVLKPANLLELWKILKIGCLLAICFGMSGSKVI